MMMAFKLNTTKTVPQYAGLERAMLNHEACKIFKMFLQRESHDAKQADKEIELMHNVTKHALDLTYTDFIKYKRTGATIRMNRFNRARMWESWKNAINHATFTVRPVETILTVGA